MPRPFRLARVTEDERVKAEDRIAIADLVARYADAVNANDAAEWGATWADECTWEPSTGRVLHGRGEIVAFWKTAMASFESVLQVVGHGHASEAGDGAVGSWTLFEVNRRDGANGIVLGHYRDRYARAQGRWLFAERRFTVTYRGSLPDGGFSGFRPRAGTGQ